MYEDKILYAKPLVEKIKNELKNEVSDLRAKGHTPILTVLQVGNNPASNVYVRNKQKDAEEIGIQFDLHKYPDTITETELYNEIYRITLVNDNKPDGCIVQLPLPQHIGADYITAGICSEVDVDCLHPYNIGRLLKNDCDMPTCTPAGIIELLKSVTEIKGKHCVIVGRSNIVGKPLALMLLNEDATVTICHSKTDNLKEICVGADILIAAIGKPKFFTEEYIKEGAIVIDVGINRDENGKLCGDVDFDNVLDKVSKITPVPGGVGLMTRVMLMKNTVNSANNIFLNKGEQYECSIC